MSIIRKSISVILCFILTFSPLLQAANKSSSDDMIAPEVEQKNYVDTVTNGSNHEVIVTVTDNNKVKQVLLYYRAIGTKEYKYKTMRNDILKDDYAATISSDEISSIGIEYYIQAKDLSGNTILHGYSFSPLSVKTVSSDSVKTASTDDKSSIKEEDDSYNKWIWIGLGVLALGAAAASSGGGDSGGETATGTLTVISNEPVQ